MDSQQNEPHTITTIVAGGVVVNDKNEVIVVNTKGTSWSLPKGHVEDGEDLLTAARREVYEESGVIDLIFVKELPIYERFKIGPGGEGEDLSEKKEIHFFLFQTHQHRLEPVDPDNPEARWVKLEEVVNLLTHPLDRGFFKSILRDIQGIPTTKETE